MSIALSDGMREVFKTAASAATGVVFFCTAGKDRTGVAAALMLSVCGADRRDSWVITP